MNLVIPINYFYSNLYVIKNGLDGEPLYYKYGVALTYKVVSILLN